MKRLMEISLIRKMWTIVSLSLKAAIIGLVIFVLYLNELTELILGPNERE